MVDYGADDEHYSPPTDYKKTLVVGEREPLASSERGVSVARIERPCAPRSAPRAMTMRAIAAG
jgi:hypothetical protein